MSRRKRNAVTRLLPIGLFLFVVLALVPACSGALASNGGCSEAAAPPRQLPLYELREALQCLVNAARERRGLSPLNDNPDLKKSAARHSADMVSEHYFGHDGPRGRTVLERIARAGYLGRVSAYSVGENIGGGAGRAFGSPLAVYRSWMHSPPHRENILDPAFHDFGVGVVRGFPDGAGSAAATYTLDFGSRR